jgi:hypothetical protein
MIHIKTRDRPRDTWCAHLQVVLVHNLVPPIYNLSKLGLQTDAREHDQGAPSGKERNAMTRCLSVASAIELEPPPAA